LLDRSSNGTDCSRFASLAAGSTTFNDTGLTPGTSYSYRVRASNAGGTSSPSPVMAVATPPLNPPDAPPDYVLSLLQDPHGRGLAMHIHPRLTIIINGQQQTIPAFIGLTYPSGSDDPNASFTSATPIHTHDTSGYLHVESTEVWTFRLGDFFNIWSHYAGGQGHPVSDPSIAFKRENILGHRVDATHRLTMTVNGQPSTAFENLALNSPDGTLFSGEASPSALDIVIDYEPISGA
jgi:hypothetical protein